MIYSMWKWTFAYTETSTFKWTLSIGCTIFAALFLLFFQPFGVNNYKPDESIDGPFLLGITIFCSALFVTLVCFEFLIQLRSNTLKSYLLRTLFEFLICSSVLFLVYNIAGGFHDFNWKSYALHILQFSSILAFPFMGIHIYFRQKQMVQQVHTLLEKTTESDLVHLSGEYQKDAISLPKNSIICAKSADNYVEVFYDENQQLKSYLLRSTLKKFGQQLPNFILRCNRSTLVNISQIHSVKYVGRKLVLNLNLISESVYVSSSNKSQVLKYIQAYTSIRP